MDCQEHQFLECHVQWDLTYTLAVKSLAAFETGLLMGTEANMMTVFKVQTCLLLVHAARAS